MITIKPIGERVDIVLPGMHAVATLPSRYGWARPTAQGVNLAGFASTDNSTGVSAREHRPR